MNTVADCKRCSPKCVLVMEMSETDGPLNIFWIECYTCFRTGPASASEEEAVRTWNRLPLVSGVNWGRIGLMVLAGVGAILLGVMLW